MPMIKGSVMGLLYQLSQSLANDALNLLILLVFKLLKLVGRMDLIKHLIILLCLSFVNLEAIFLLSSLSIVDETGSDLIWRLLFLLLFLMRSLIVGFLVWNKIIHDVHRRNNNSWSWSWSWLCLPVLDDENTLLLASGF